MAFLDMFGKPKEVPTATRAEDRLSLVLSYQRANIDDEKIKQFQLHLIQLCDEFGYDVVGEVEVIPQSKERDTIINASIPVRVKKEN